MRLTPLQVQEIVGISRDTLRHWRKVLSPLKGKNGYRPCFTLGDALALKTVQLMANNFGISVKAISNVAPELFSICQSKGWATREDCWIAVDLHHGVVSLIEDVTQFSIQSAVMVIPMGQLMSELRQTMLGDTVIPTKQQLELALPPGKVAGQENKLSAMEGN